MRFHLLFAPQPSPKRRPAAYAVVHADLRETASKGSFSPTKHQRRVRRAKIWKQTAELRA